MIERGGGGFGSGSHATTRMCLALLLELDPARGAADLGCGLGTLAIAAARLGWSPVVAVDRMEGAVAAARANGARNGVQVDWRVADLETAPIPLDALLLVNAPRRCTRASRTSWRSRRARLPRVHRVIVSGLVPGELAAVAPAYASAGWAVAARLEEDGWAAALLEPAGA